MKEEEEDEKGKEKTKTNRVIGSWGEMCDDGLARLDETDVLSAQAGSLLAKLESWLASSDRRQCAQRIKIGQDTRGRERRRGRGGNNLL